MSNGIKSKQPLPDETPITEIVSERGYAQLTDRAKGLTKAQLTDLLYARAVPRDLNLTVEDVRSVGVAFRNSLAESAGPEAMAVGDIRCCCCPCCCCCAAGPEAQPLGKLA